MIRLAKKGDIPAITAIYDTLHDLEEQGKATIGWIRGVYPTQNTASAAIERGDMFVMEKSNKIVASAIINQTQVPEYYDAHWHKPDAPDNEIMVLHTLTVDPSIKGHGYGSEFVSFYERYALLHGCKYLRMDTNAKNAAARRLYSHLDYIEADIVPCEFNGIPGVSLVCLEKYLGDENDDNMI